MRHFLSLVLGLVLAPVIWGGLAFGMERTGKAQATLAPATDDQRLIGAALLVGAGLALGVLLGTRLSPLGPALAGLIFVAASGLALAPKSAIFTTDVHGLSKADHTTLLAPLQVGVLWAVGAALLIPLLVPSRWRKAAPSAASMPPGAPNVPPGPGSRQSGAPGWSATTAQGAAVSPAAAPASGGGFASTGTGPQVPSFGAPENANPHAQTRQYTSREMGAGGVYGAESGPPPSWSATPSPQDKAYPASTYPSSAPDYSPTPYSAGTYGSGAYPASTYGGGGPNYQAGYSEPSGGYQQPPSSYAPTTYGRSRSADETPTDESVTAPAAEPSGEDELPVRRADATRRVLRPAPPPPPSRSSSEDSEQTREV